MKLSTDCVYRFMYASVGPEDEEHTVYACKTCIIKSPEALCLDHLLCMIRELFEKCLQFYY